MIAGELKSRIDKLWEEFWTGGIANPLTVIEQISFLMFARLLDITETRNEKRAACGRRFANVANPPDRKCHALRHTCYSEEKVDPCNDLKRRAFFQGGRI